jgi:N-acetyl-D-muramate 6-phosphate phosphatase
MHSVFERLNAARVPWGVVTNKPHPMARSLMYWLPTPPGCKALIGSGVAARAKPYPHGLRMAAEMIGVQPESCWYVGDDLRDIEAARRTPMLSVAAGWGYIQSDEDWRHWGADISCATVAELDSLVAAHV